MARIRTIKPEFWTSEQIMECNPMTRLLFIGIWNFCDDAGNHPASSKTIKALVFPGDDITSADVQRMLDELSTNGLIAFYDASGKTYLHVTGWLSHQKIDRPTYKFPKPDIDPPEKDDRRPKRRNSQPEPPDNSGNSATSRQQLDDSSTSDRRGLTPGREGKGSNNTLSPAHDSAADPSHDDAPFAMHLEWEPDQRALKAYATRAGIPLAAFTPEATSGFVVYHDPRGETKTEREWVSSLVNWIKRDITAAAGAASRPANVRPFARPGAEAIDFDSTGWLGAER